MKRMFAVSFLAALVVPVVLPAQSGRPAIQCEPGNGGLTLPAGFCAVVVAENVGAARHLVVSPSGDIYVAIRNQPDAPRSTRRSSRVTRRSRPVCRSRSTS